MKIKEVRWFTFTHSKLPENVQTVLSELKRRVLSDMAQPVTKIYEEEVKKFVSLSSLRLYYMRIVGLISFSIVKMAQPLLFQSSELRNQHYILFVKRYYLQLQ